MQAANRRLGWVRHRGEDSLLCRSDDGEFPNLESFTVAQLQVWEAIAVTPIRFRFRAVPGVHAN